MIKKSFIFLPGIESATEKRLWCQGIYCWDDFLKTKRINGLSKKRKSLCDLEIKKASEAIKQGRVEYFLDKLKQKHMWRLYSYFADEAAFIDIESSGVRAKDNLIAIAVFDGFSDKVMIKGVNLNLSYLRQELSKYKLIITYNGASFDLPFLEKRYPSLLPRAVHIDLKPLCQRAGYSDGLKEIEKKFGVNRNPVLQRLYGGDVYRLWRMFFATGDNYYLNLLAEYNSEDVINLKRIADYMVKENEKLLGHPKPLVAL
ncbi:MAG: ribonuclease H-like domain-containing protein [Candidatus Nanoarchaeia archaeon]